MKKASEKLAEISPSDEEKKLLRRFAELPIDAILTTNYTYELEKALAHDFACSAGRRCRYRTCRAQTAGRYEKQQLHTCFEISENTPPIWHIHGEAARHSTMVIGHYYYGKLIAKAQAYLASRMARFKSLQKEGDDHIPTSWLDSFVLGDVYIVGLGMDLSEMDLWWLVSFKKLYFKDTRVVLYKPDIKPVERMLAEAYQVEVLDGGLCCNDYRCYYEWVHHHIRESLQPK